MKKHWLLVKLIDQWSVARKGWVTRVAKWFISSSILSTQLKIIDITIHPIRDRSAADLPPLLSAGHITRLAGRGFGPAGRLGFQERVEKSRSHHIKPRRHSLRHFFPPPPVCLSPTGFFLRDSHQIKARAVSHVTTKSAAHQRTLLQWIHCRGIQVWDTGFSSDLPVSCILWHKMTRSMNGALRGVLGPKVRGVLEQARPRAGWWLKRKDTTATWAKPSFPCGDTAAQHCSTLHHTAAHCRLS